MPRILGLTGNIACGKTAVGQMLLKLGAERYIDADAVVHKLYEGGQPIAVKISDAFGPNVMTADGSVDRKALGAIVFQDADAMCRLEAIVHPAVSIALVSELASVSPSGIAIIDAVKLLGRTRTGPLDASQWLD
jgi:dephospho-CoA kinase